MLATRVLTSKKKNHWLLYKEFGDICDNLYGINHSSLWFRFDMQWVKTVLNVLLCYVALQEPMIMALTPRMLNLSIRDSDCNTPLHVAILAEDLLTIRLLIICGADLFLKNKDDKTPYQLALENKLVGDLFNSNQGVNKEVRRQKLNYHINNINELFDEEEQEVELGITPQSFNLTHENMERLLAEGPVETLQEICVEKVSELCSATRTT